MSDPGVQLIYTHHNPNDGSRQYGDVEQVRCPSCGDEYVSCGSPSRVDGADDYKAWSGRGDLIVVPMECESGHAWEVCFGFHKGYTFSFIRNLRDVH